MSLGRFLLLAPVAKIISTDLKVKQTAAFNTCRSEWKNRCFEVYLLAVLSVETQFRT